MEEADSSNSHVSFLSLLMAPDDNTTTPDHHIYHNTPPFHNHFLSFPCSSPFDVSDQNPAMSQPLSMPPFSDNYYVDNNYVMHQNNSSSFDVTTNTNTHFLPQLPNLLSLENFTPPPPPPPPPPQPPQQSDDYTLNSIVANFQSSHKDKQPEPEPEQNKNRARARAPRRQSKISEKVYKLGKLLPGGHRHRNCTADMLEEAHKYIKFLQAQVSVLNTMPTQDSLLLTQHQHSGGGATSNNNDNAQTRPLATLSRQQLLQVVLNSPAAQVVMADNGWCLFSAEQLAFIKRAQARHKIIQQLLTSLPL